MKKTLPSFFCHLLGNGAPVVRLFWIYVLLFNFCFTSSTSAQLTVAVGEFINQSDQFYLDQWEQSVPELLQAKLADSPDIILVERRKLTAVLEEKALGLTGLTDTSSAREIGTLLEAQYLVFGHINELDDEFRIDASIVKTSTGQILSEKVVGPDRDHLSRMIDLLGNNILYKLTGDGDYQSSVKTGKSPTLIFLGTTVGLGAGTIIASSKCNGYREDYQNNTELDRFDDLYDKANRTRKITVALASATGVALISTLYFWIRNRSSGEIYADSQPKKVIVPLLTLNKKNEILLGIQISY